MPIMCMVQLPAGKAPEQIEATLEGYLRGTHAQF